MQTAVASSNPLLWHGLTESSFPHTPKPEVWPNTNMSSFVSATVAIVYGHPFSQILMRGGRGLYYIKSLSPKCRSALSSRWPWFLYLYILSFIKNNVEYDNIISKFLHSSPRFQTHLLHAIWNFHVQPPPPQSDIISDPSKLSLFLCAVLFPHK